MSDHTNDINSSIVSCCLGAKIIEKHFILRKIDKTYDRDFSIDPKKLKTLNLYSNLIYKTLNQKNDFTSFFNNGENNSKLFRRSIYLKENMKKGSKINLNNIISLRPSIGIESKNIFKVLGKTINKNKRINSPLRFSDLKK